MTAVLRKPLATRQRHPGEAGIHATLRGHDVG
jgi:hypothetical protein